MRSNGWWAGALAATAMVAGCAHEQVNQEQLGRLPIGEKNAIFAAQHNVTVAEANEAESRKAYGQAQQFAGIMANETKLAKEHAKLARQTFDLGRKTNNPETLRAADRADKLAVKEDLSARSGREFADRLVALRAAEVDLAKAHYNEAVAEKNFVEADSLRRNNIEPGVNFAKLTQQREEARIKAVDEERKAAALRDEANTARLTWNERRRSLDVAMARPGPAEIPSIQAPGAAPQVRPAPQPEAGPSAVPKEGTTPSPSTPDHTM